MTEKYSDIWRKEGRTLAEETAKAKTPRQEQGNSRKKKRLGCVERAGKTGKSRKGGQRGQVCGGARTRLWKALLWAVVSTWNDMGKLWRGFFPVVFF